MYKYLSILKMRKNEKQLNSVTGFTLVELLLAVAILVFGVCSILVAYMSCSILVSTSKNINIAMNAALSLNEEIRSAPFTQIIDNYNGLIFTVNDIVSSKGRVYAEPVIIDAQDYVQVTTSICWRQGNRIMGEDTDLDGSLDAGEDANGNGKIDSPVELVTLIANR